MTGDEIKALRRAIDHTARALGVKLGVDQSTVLAWEREELFPTKRHVIAMRALLEKDQEAQQASSTPHQPSPTPHQPSPTPFEGLADPAVWQLFRKILAHTELRLAVEKLATHYEDPSREG